MTKRMTVAFEVWIPPEEGEEKSPELTQLSADNFHHMMEQTDGLELPDDQHWNMAVAYFGMGKPIRIHYSYRVGKEDIAINEQNHSGRARHTLPADMGGPVPIHELLGWTQSLQSIGDWLQW